MDKKTKAAIKRTISMICLVLVVALLAAMPLLTRRSDDDGAKATILADQTQRRTIVDRIYGGGPLTADTSAKIDLPKGVKVTRLLAENGDIVNEGDPIAELDPISIMTAATEVQESLVNIAKKLNTARGKINPGIITVDEEGNLLCDGKKVPADKLSSYADFLTLSQQHREYETLLVELFRLYQTRTVTASGSGMVDGLDKSIVSKLSGAEGAQLHLLADHRPDGEENEEENTFAVTAFKLIDKEGDTSWLVKKRSMGTVEITDFAALTAPDASFFASDYELLTMPVLALTPAVRYSNEAWESAVLSLKDGSVVLLVHHGEGETEGSWLIDVSTGSGSGSGSLPNFDWSSFFGRGGYSAPQEPTLYSTDRKTVCTVIPMDTMRIYVPVDELDIARFTVGMTAEVTLDALPNQLFTAQVTEVSKFGASNGGSSKFNVTLELPRAEGMLPGMNAAAAFAMGSQENLLTVPVAALVDQGSATVIYTGYDEKNEILTNPVAVTTGASDGEFVQILSGLSDGSSFFYSYYDTMEISTEVETRGLF